MSALFGRRLLFTLALALSFPAAKGAPMPLNLATAPSGAFRLMWAGQGTPIVISMVAQKQTAGNLPSVEVDVIERGLRNTVSTDKLYEIPLTFISPDETWIFVQRGGDFRGRIGILYRRADPAAEKGLPRYVPAAAERFDLQAWRFYARENQVPEEEIAKAEPDGGMSIQFGGWSDDSGRLLFNLSGRIGTYDRPIKDVRSWLCYFNTRMGVFERTDRLLAVARTNPSGENTDGVLKPESIGQEGPERPAMERFSKADVELNEVYAELLGKLSSAAKAQLRAEERAWISERDLFATVYANQSWSLHPGASNTEGMAVFTEKRVSELRKRMAAKAN